MKEFRFYRSALVLAGLSAGVFLPAGAAIVARLTLEEMTAAAEVVVLGRVERAEAAWSDDGRIIVTRVEIAVERSVKGGPRRRVAFEVPGGRIGDQMLVASGAPVFRAGDRVVLFLSEGGGPAGAGAPGRPGIVGWNQGAIRVERDAATGREIVRPQVAGTVGLDRDRQPAGAAGAAGPWPLARFLEEVETFVGRRSTGPPGSAP